MLSTYRALLTDNQLEWLDEKPLLTGKTAIVYVTLIEEQQTASPHQAIEILAKIAELNGGIKQITDPVEWQREQVEQIIEDMST